MDLTTLHQGVMFAVSAVASAAFSLPSDVPAQGGSLYQPEIVESYNLTPAENPESSFGAETLYNLNSLNNPVDDSLKLIIKEANAQEPVITVEQPPIVTTVVQPTPKPKASASPKPAEQSNTLKIPESAKEEELKPESTAKPVDQTPSVSLNSSNADLLFRMTNDYRSGIGKPAFEKDERLCRIAERRAPDVKPELASGNLHKGFKELNLPYWATENIAAYQTMQENFNFLSTDYIHRKAIESDAKYSCTACAGTSCSQIFSSFLSK